MSSESAQVDRPTIKESIEERETKTLHRHATLSKNSKGRKTPESLCPLRTDFQRDRDRIIHSKAFRRLKHKTQVFIAPIGDHYRTRMTHSIEVAQVSRTIARGLQLNEDLTESIALGHDLGHPPFGHTGERILNEISPSGFHHQVQSIRIVTNIESLNLTQEVLDGIKGGPTHTSLESQVVELADRMAYLHHDVEDALRAGLMTEEELPSEVISILGRHRQDRLQSMVYDMVESSLKTFDSDTPSITMTDTVREAMMELRQWMFDHVYLKQEEIAQTEKVRLVITGLFHYFVNHPDQISSSVPTNEPPEIRAVDYIAGMTDRFAIDLYKKLLLPNPYQRRIEDDLESEFMGLLHP